MKHTVALGVLVAGLMAFGACRSEESTAQTATARGDQKPAAGAQPATNSPQRADRGQTASGRPHEKDSDLLQDMK